MKRPTTTFVTSDNGVKVAAHDYGGDGKPTLFVHGTGLVSRMWEPIIDGIGEEFRAICIDLRAHGATKNPENIDFFEDRMVADLTSVVDELELRKAWIVGHSMGGATSILTSLNRRDAFTKAWVYEPIIFERTDHQPPGSFDFVEATKRRRSIFGSRQEAIDRYGSRPPLDELARECLEAYVQYGFVDLPDGSVQLACDPQLESRAFEQFLQQGWEQLPNVDIDVLVAYGADGKERSSIAAPAIAQRLPKGVPQRFDRANHFGCFGRVNEVVASLRNWFLGDK